MKMHSCFPKLLAIVVILSMSFTLLSSVVRATANEQPLPFVDVNPHDWFYSQVRDMFEQGIMTGTAAETFHPNQNATRAMVAQVLYNYAGRPPVSGFENPFTDVSADAWYHDAVVWASWRGIVSGFGDGTFAPGDDITRAHLTILLHNYTRSWDGGLPTLRPAPSFIDDADIRNYAREAIDRFFQAMLINGRPDGSFDPQGSATRAELATMLSGFVQISGARPTPPVPPYGVFPSPPPPMPEYGFFCEDF